MNSGNNKRCWLILSLNIRGINSEGKWDAIRSKISESKSDIICLQETKKESFDISCIKKFCTPQLDSFAFLPSIGACGGSLIVWNGSKLSREEIFQNEFAQSVELTCKLSELSWILTNVYAPCTPEGKVIFFYWFRDISMPDDLNWLIVGDFNLIRSPKNRNKPSGNLQEMFAFNEEISRLRLVEIRLKGCKFTWTNKQLNPLLERLGWFFTSNSWTTTLPNTVASAMSRALSGGETLISFLIFSRDWPKQ